MADETVLMIGTRKGLWLGRSDAHAPAVDHRGSALPDGWRSTPAWSTPAASDHACWSGRRSSWTGPQVFSSDDLGQTWQEHPIGFPDGTRRLASSASGSWCPGPSAEVVYAGTEPAAVFKSTDQRRDLRPRAGAVGPPAPHRVGRRLRRAGLPHPAPAPRRTATR